MLPFVRRPLRPKSARSHRNTVSSQRVQRRPQSIGDGEVSSLIPHRKPNMLMKDYGAHRGAMTSIMMEASGICIDADDLPFHSAWRHIARPNQNGPSKAPLRERPAPSTFISTEPALPRRHPLGIEVAQ